MADSPEPDAPAELRRLLNRAETAGASDVHLQSVDAGLEVAFRLDGLLQRIEVIAPELAERLLGRVKYLARLQTWQQATPQDGRIERAEAGTRADIRVATYPTVSGEKVVLRLFRNEETPALDELGLSDKTHATLNVFLSQPAGMLLLTGPAGSGKSTTIYACLRELAKRGERHTITIEDPVERVVPGIMQTEVNEAQGLTYAKAARHLLRQDPQVLVLGEIRDAESALIAAQTALTGHLVISTLHAGSCTGVIDRLWSMIPDHFTVSRSLSLVVNQRLLRRHCPACGGTACGECLETGYRGRVPILESLVIDDETRNTLMTDGPAALNEPSPSLREQAVELVKAKATGPEELDRVLGS